MGRDEGPTLACTSSVCALRRSSERTAAECWRGFRLVLQKIPFSQEFAMRGGRVRVLVILPYSPLLKRHLPLFLFVPVHSGIPGTDPCLMQAVENISMLKKLAAAA